MQFRFWRTTRRREFEEEHQPNGTSLESRESGHQRHEVARAGAEASRLTEASSEWLWWLPSPTPEGALSGRGSDREARGGRRWSLDELDEPTLPPAA
jgi:hypothetical protein